MNPASDYNANILGFFDRQLAHDGHTDTSAEALVKMFNMRGKDEVTDVFSMVALAHPNFPFHIRFLYELKLCPPEVSINEMSCVKARPEDYYAFLQSYDLTVDEASSLPKNWFIALLEK